MLTENEICRAFNVAFCEELGAGLGEYGILVPEKFAGVVALVLLFERISMSNGNVS